MTQKAPMPSLYYGHPAEEVSGDWRWNRDKLYPVPVSSHSVCIAASGGGKTTRSLVPNLLTWRGSAFVFDPFGQLAYLTGPWRAANVGPVRILDPWRELDAHFMAEAAEVFAGTPDGGRFPEEWYASFNALDGLDLSDDDFHDELSGRVGAVVEPISRDPYWDQSSQQLLRGLATWSIKVGRPHWGHVRDLITLPFARLHDEVIVPAVDDGGYAGRQLARFMLAKPEPTNEMLSVLSNAIEQTNFLESRRITASLATSTFDFAELAGPAPTTVYVVLPPDKFEGIARKWLRMVLQAALRAVMQSRPRAKVLFALDEFGTVGRLSEVETAMGLARGSGVALYLMLQSIGQLKKHYKDNWQTFMANADAVQYFTIKDYETAEHVARESGHYYHMGGSQSSGPGGDSVSYKEELRAAMRPEEVMVRSQRHVMLKHLSPASDEVYQILGFCDYFGMPELKARARRHPRFDAPNARAASGQSAPASRKGSWWRGSSS